MQLFYNLLEDRARGFVIFSAVIKDISKHPTFVKSNQKIYFVFPLIIVLTILIKCLYLYELLMDVVILDLNNIYNEAAYSAYKK